MNSDKKCRRVNGQVICEDIPPSGGGLFGGSSAPPSTRQSRQTYPQTYSAPRPVNTSPPKSNVMTVAIPPKELIEKTQYGDVIRANCRKDKKTGKLRCKVVTE